jgi:two-component system phosphate regulon sensor histidine kinase PhoR
MNFPRNLCNLEVRLLLALTLALALAWIVEPRWIGDSVLARSAVVGTCLVLAFGLCHFEACRIAAKEREARRHVELLSRWNHHDLASADGRTNLPEIQENTPWQQVLTGVRNRLIEFGSRADAAEHSAKAAEVRYHRLARAHSQVVEILDGLTEPVLATNEYDELIWWNRAAATLFKLAERSDDAEVLHVSAVRCDSLAELLMDTRRHRSTCHRCAEISLSEPSGDLRWSRVACRALQGDPADGSNGHGAVAVLTDITVEKNIQKRHADFVAAVSHEMKTPLAGIRAYVELLHDDENMDAKTRCEFLEVVDFQAGRLQRLIENLLNLARIETGVISVDKQRHSINEILEHAAEVLLPAAKDKQLQLVNELSPLHVEVLVDRDMMIQVAMNLLSNAIKYTQDGGRVTIRSHLDSDCVTFECEDTGIGLTEEDCRRVFERFYRVQGGKSMATGTGLGLPLARHIVEDVHGGSLTVNSTVGKGSVFRVVLPSVAKGKV